MSIDEKWLRQNLIGSLDADIVANIFRLIDFKVEQAIREHEKRCASAEDGPTSEELAELEPCPFCGAAACFDVKHPLIGCTRCGAEMHDIHLEFTFEHLARMWNRRAKEGEK